MQQHRDITTAKGISDYGLDHLEYSCHVAHTSLEETIHALNAYLAPFQPARLIHTLDTLYYQLIDHSTDQEITMLKQAFSDYIEHREHHTKVIKLLAESNHQKLQNSFDDAAELTSAIQSWSRIHQQQERQYAIFLEARRFIR